MNEVKQLFEIEEYKKLYDLVKSYEKGWYFLLEIHTFFPKYYNVIVKKYKFVLHTSIYISFYCFVYSNWTKKKCCIITLFQKPHF